MILRFFLLFSLCSLLACEQESDSKKKLYSVALGHTYQWGADGNKVDTRIEKVDLSKYENVWLLGDICAATTRDSTTLTYLDNLFDLTNLHTDWAIGNHDIQAGSIKWITEKTLKEFSYGYKENDVATFVLNTQIQHEIFKDSCDYKRHQYDNFLEFLEDVRLDKNINTLFVLTHNTVWSNCEESLKEYELIGNAKAAWMDFLCEWDSGFKSRFYPKLKELQLQKKQIHLIAGDGGQYQKTFFHEGSSGIKYYVSGINNSVIGNSDQVTIDRFNTSPDSILVFSKSHDNKSFLGEFVSIDNL